VIKLYSENRSWNCQSNSTSVLDSRQNLH